MSKLAIYKFNLIKSDNKNLFTKEGQAATKSAHQIFGEMLSGKKLKLTIPQKNGDTIVYPNDITCYIEDVAVVRIQCEKHLGQWKDNYTMNKIPTYPWCYVIIDNRKGVSQMLIEPSSAFDGNPDKVRDILQTYFNALLNEYGLEIEIKAKIVEKEFWNYIFDKEIQEKDTIKEIRFEFTDPNSIEDFSMPRSHILRAHFELMKLINSTKGEMRFQNNKQGSLSFKKGKRIQQDLAQMVRLCCNNGYTITIIFRKSGKYRYGDQQREVREVPEGYITNFENKQTTVGEDGESYDLLMWLDNIRGTSNRQTNEGITRRRRKAGVKR